MNAMLPDGPYVADGLLFRAEHLVLPFMAARIPGMEGMSFGPASAIGVLSAPDPETGRARIVGGVAYAFWFDHPEGGDVQVSMVMEPGARVTRRMWRHLYGHAFVTMNCRRMSMQTAKDNRAARFHAERMGWRLEGTRPEGQGRKTLMLYGMLRSRMRDGLPPMRPNKEATRHG